MVLQLLNDNHLYAKMKKCVFGVDQVEYLGHVINASRVSTSLEKIVTIKEWQTQ